MYVCVPEQHGWRDADYRRHDLSSPVKTDSSFWTIEDDTLHITLQKRDKGQTWQSPILGQGQLDPCAIDLERKRLMFQRFQEEELCETTVFTLFRPYTQGEDKLTVKGHNFFFVAYKNVIRTRCACWWILYLSSRRSR